MMTDSLLTTIQSTIHTHHLLARVADETSSCRPHVLVALSGGCDSVVLLHTLLALGYRVCALHFNHNLRGDEADADQRFCENLCHRLDVPLQVVSEHVADYATASKLSIEQAGRELRYTALEAYGQAMGVEAIATGHHSDDTAETLLLNLIRGTGLAGLTGIVAKRGQIIRPLIDCTRADIEAYAYRHHLAYQTDSTNTDTIYTRNKIRHEILPLLAHINPKISQALKQTADLLAADNAHLNQVAEEGLFFFTQGAVDSWKPTELIVLSADTLAMTDRSVQTRILMLAVKKVAAPRSVELAYTHIQSLLSLLHKPSGKSINLPSGLIATKSYDKLMISQKKEVTTSSDFCYNIALGLCVYINEHQFYVSLSTTPRPDHWQHGSGQGTQILQNIYTKAVQYDKIAEVYVTVRNRQPGDYVSIQGVGRQSLKKYFINNKIPADRRQPMVCAIGSRVVYMPDLYEERQTAEQDEVAYLQIWSTHDRAV